MDLTSLKTQIIDALLPRKTSRRDRTIFSTVNVEAYVYSSGNKKSFETSQVTQSIGRISFSKIHIYLLKWDLSQFSVR